MLSIIVVFLRPLENSLINIFFILDSCIKLSSPSDIKMLLFCMSVASFANLNSIFRFFKEIMFKTSSAALCLCLFTKKTGVSIRKTRKIKVKNWKTQPQATMYLQSRIGVLFKKEIKRAMHAIMLEPAQKKKLIRDKMCLLLDGQNS